MILFSRSSDRMGERTWHVVVAMGLGAAGLLLTGMTIGSAPLELIGLCIAGFGIGADLPIFWTLPTAYLGAATAAAGIAVINSFGNLSGYAAPQLVGLLRDRTGNYGAAMLTCAAIMVVSAALIRLAAVRVPSVPLRGQRKPDAANVRPRTGAWTMSVRRCPAADRLPGAMGVATDQPLPGAAAP